MKRKSRIKKKCLIKILFFCFAAIIIFSCPAGNVQAAKKVKVKINKWVKAGSYSFRLQDNCGDRSWMILYVKHGKKKFYLDDLVKKAYVKGNRLYYTAEGEEIGGVYDCIYDYKKGKVVASFYRTTYLEKVKKNSANSVKLEWLKFGKVDKYIIYRSTSPYGKYKKIAITSGQKKSNEFEVRYVDKNLKPGTYYYRVRAKTKFNGKIRYSKCWPVGGKPLGVTIRGASGNVSEQKTAVQPTISILSGNSGGSSTRLSVQTCPSNMGIVWKSSNTAVAKVANGYVSAVGEGAAVITASMMYGGKIYTASKVIAVRASRTYGEWSSWSLNPVEANSQREVKTTVLYRYYYFLCPVCGGREPLQGISDCHQYTLRLADAVAGWFTTPYTRCNSSAYSYASYKRYTTSLGDGQIWNFSTGNMNDTAVGTKDSDSEGIVICTGYSTRNVTTNYVITQIR